MRPNSKKEYYISPRTNVSLSQLPSFMKKGTDSTLFTLSNPQNIEFDRFYHDITESALNLNPTTLDLSLPDFIYTFSDLAIGSGVTGANSELEEVSLYDFNFNLPTRSATAASVVDAVIGVTGANYIDMHHVAPITYTLDDYNYTVAKGYIGLREGSWLTNDLISVFDAELNLIESFGLPAVEQNLSSASDEWIELDENLSYSLDNKFIVKDSLTVVNPHTGTIVDEAGYTFSNSTLTFYEAPEFTLVVEYSYVPSPVLHSLYYSTHFHDISVSQASSAANPTGFLFLITDQPDLSAGVSAGADYSHPTGTTRSINSYDNTLSEADDIKINFTATDVSVDQEVSVTFKYYATYSYDLFDGTLAYWGYANDPYNHLLVVNDFIDPVKDTILINGIKVINVITEEDITAGFTFTNVEGSTGAYLTRVDLTITGSPDTFEIQIPYIREITQTEAATIYSEPMTDIFTVTDVSASSTFYLNFSYVYGGTSDYHSYITFPTTLSKQFTMDTAGATLTIGSTFDVSYEGLSNWSVKQKRLWADNGITIDHSVFKSGAGASTTSTYTYQDSVNNIEIISLETETNYHASTVYYPEKIHSVDSYFDLITYSLNDKEGKIELYTASQDLHDIYNLYFIEYGVTGLDGTSTYYASAVPTHSSIRKRPVGLQLFHDSIALLEEDISSGDFNLEFKDVHTLNSLATLNTFTTGATSDTINSFTFNSDNDCQLFSGGTGYTIPLYYDYLTRIVDEDTSTESLYFREEYAGATVTGGTGLVYSFSDRETSVVEHSVDHWGRIFGSDRWPKETLKDYLNRLTNITEAKGASSFQKSLDGISATLGSPSYNISTRNSFDLRYPAAVSTESQTVFLQGPTATISTNYPINEFISATIYHSDGENYSITLADLVYTVGSTGTDLSLITGGATTGDSVNIKYKPYATLSINGEGSTGPFTLIYENETHDSTAVLTIDKQAIDRVLAYEDSLITTYSCSDFVPGGTFASSYGCAGTYGGTTVSDSCQIYCNNGQYTAEISYYANTTDDIFDPVLYEETNIHYFTDVVSGLAPLTENSSHIVINDLINSSYIAENSVNNIPGATASDLINMGKGPFLYKWGEFFWDNYNWKDGESLKLGLKTIFDAHTATLSVTDPKFSNGVASGNHLKFLGFDKDKKGVVQTGQFYYKDKQYYLGSAMQVTAFPVDSGYQPMVLWEEGATFSIDLPITDTPIVVQRDEPSILYSAQNSVDINSINSNPYKEDLGDKSTVVTALSGNNDLNVVEVPYDFGGGTTDRGFEVFVTGATGGTGASADYVEFLDGVIFSESGSNHIELTDAQVIYITNDIESDQHVWYIYNSDRYVATPGPEDSPPNSSIIGTDKSLRHSVDVSLSSLITPLSDVYPEVSEIIQDISGATNEYFMIDDFTEKRIKIEDQGWLAGSSANHHIFSFDTEEGNEYTIKSINMDFHTQDLGNKILALGDELLPVKAITTKLSSSIIDSVHHTMKITIEAKDEENGYVPNALFTLTGATFTENSCITKADGLCIINTDIQMGASGATGDISITVSYKDLPFDTFTITNIGEV